LAESGTSFAAYFRMAILYGSTRVLPPAARARGATLPHDKLDRLKGMGYFK
jgi:hypothetical protein